MKFNLLKLNRKQIHNAADNFMREYGENIRKRDVRFTLNLNEGTAKLWYGDRDRIINRIWRRIKIIKKLKMKEADDET